MSAADNVARRREEINVEWLLPVTVDARRLGSLYPQIKTKTGISGMRDDTFLFTSTIILLKY